MERPRCPTHGLVIGDAGCLRCHHQAVTTPARGPSLMIAALVGVVGLAVVGMLAVRVVSALTDRPARTVLPDRSPSPTVAPAARGAPEPATATPSPAGESREARIAAEMKSIPVTLYSADYCPWCRKAKAHMTARGIAYTELHIDENAAAKREMARIGGRGIPTIDIEGDVHSGYNPAWVERTLRAHAERRVAGR